MNRLWLARHAQTEWNVENRMQGHHDSPLTELGHRQASALGQALKNKPLSAIFVSTAQRAQRTATYVHQFHPHIPFIPTDDLREIHLGPWEGLTKAEIQQRWPNEVDLFWHHPAQFQAIEGGEDYRLLFQRLQRWWQTFFHSAQQGEWLVVSHGVTLQVLFLLLENRRLEDLHRDQILAQCSLSLVEWETGHQPRLVFRNNTDHL